MTAERIRALEVQQDGTSEKLQLIHSELAAIRQEVTENNRDFSRELGEIKQGLNRQRGYIAGAMSVIVVIWTAILSAIAVLWDKLVDSFGTMWP